MLDPSVAALKILIHSQENLLRGGTFSVKLRVLYLYMGIYI